MDMERVGSASASRARDADVTHAKGPASAFVRSSTTADEIRSLSAVLRRFLGTGRRVRARSAQPAPRARGRDDAEPVRFAGAAEPAGRWRVAEAQSVRVERAAGVRRGRRANVRGSPPDATPMGPRRVRGHPRGASGGPVSTYGQQPHQFAPPPTATGMYPTPPEMHPQGAPAGPAGYGTPWSQPDHHPVGDRGWSAGDGPGVGGVAPVGAPPSAAHAPATSTPSLFVPAPQPSAGFPRSAGGPTPPAPTLFVPPRDAGAGRRRRRPPRPRPRRPSSRRRSSRIHRRAARLQSPFAAASATAAAARGLAPRPSGLDPQPTPRSKTPTCRGFDSDTRGFPRAFGRNTPR